MSSSPEASGRESHPPVAHSASLSNQFLTCLGRSPLITWFWPDCSDAQVWFPGAMMSALGYGPGELEPTIDTFADLLHPEDRATFNPTVRAIIGERQAGEFDYEYRLRRKDGRYVQVRGISSIGYRPEIGSLCAFGMARILDADEEHGASALGLATDALHIVLNEIGHPVVLMATDGLVLQSNDATARLVGSEYSGVALRYCPFLHEQDGTVIVPDFLSKVIGTGRRQERELQRFGRWWHVHLVPLRDQSFRVVRLMLLAQDITAIKNEQQAQIAHQKALTAVLLREIHHRIKNHLQGLVGLLRFHANSMRSVDSVVEAASAQVLSIAAVHGLLSARDGAVELSELLARIVDSMRAGSAIRLSFSLASPVWQPVVLSQDQAVPLAVSVAELLTNAIKHTRQEPGAAVETRLSSTGTAIELQIANYPASLPDGFRLPDATAPPSGLVLIQTLLPRERARLDIRQRGQEVVTVLHVELAKDSPAQSS